MKFETILGGLFIVALVYLLARVACEQERSDRE
jgi:hypothetical protein